MSAPLHLFVGSLNRKAPYFKGAHGVGLSVWTFCEDTLEARQIFESGDVDNPGFLAFDAPSATLYAVSEVFSWREGVVSAYRFDQAGSKLVYLNKQPTLGSITAHVSVTRDRRHVLVANYAMGEGGPDQAVTIYGRRDDGELTPPLSSVALAGTGPNADRQERSHPHCAVETLDEAYVAVADLGTDRVNLFRRGADGALALAGGAALPPGAGPRHIAFHPGNRFVLVMNELDSTLAVFRREGTGLELVDLQPSAPTGIETYAADIHLSPDGRFVYASNRGHDSIAAFAIDAASGRLTALGTTPSGGATPRNFALTPSGAYLLVANQNGDNITVLRRDAQSGRLADTGRRIAVGTPMCVRPVAL